MFGVCDDDDVGGWIFVVKRINSDLTLVCVLDVGCLRCCVLDVGHSWLLISDDLGVEWYWMLGVGQCWVLVDHEGLFRLLGVAFWVVDG